MLTAYRLHISMSVAFLSGLAVTVLIIYLMHPPVSDGVQGGFFVAVVVTAGLFGALSLIFPEVTEGLGCLLGGFCLSMWFLVLKPDGLIGSQGGRAIFIGAMSLIAFSFSFSHYTRQYALIVCMSFAGATATILGIDCFSRAGLKEFWLYLWSMYRSRCESHDQQLKTLNRSQQQLVSPQYESLSPNPRHPSRDCRHRLDLPFRYHLAIQAMETHQGAP